MLIAGVTIELIATVTQRFPSSMIITWNPRSAYASGVPAAAALEGGALVKRAVVGRHEDIPRTFATQMSHARKR